MKSLTEETCEHLLELQAGTSGSIDLRFPKDRRKRLHMKMAAADRGTGVVELVLGNLRRGYEIMRFFEGADDVRWTQILPGADGEVYAVLDLNAGERLNIESDDHDAHSLRLMKAAWCGDILHLTFREGK